MPRYRPLDRYPFGLLNSHELPLVPHLINAPFSTIISRTPDLRDFDFQACDST